jgi:hypothetical protein
MQELYAKASPLDVRVVVTDVGIVPKQWKWQVVPQSWQIASI